MTKKPSADVKAAVFALIYTAVLMSMFEYVFFPPKIQSWLNGGSLYQWEMPSLTAGIIWGTACFTGYLLIPYLIVKFQRKERLKNVGANLDGFFKHLKVYLGLYLLTTPLIFMAARMPSFQTTYPFILEARQTFTKFLIWECFYILQFISLEAFFRGYMIFTLEKVMDPLLAIAAMVVPYTMIHFHKPLPECLGAVVAGLFLGWLSLKYHSWVGGAVVHALVAVTMDSVAVHRLGLF